MILGMLRLQDVNEDIVIGMITSQAKMTEACRCQQTMGWPLKIILTKPTYINSRNYNDLPYNYRYLFHFETLTLIFHVEVEGLTRSGRCFTLEELKRHKKAMFYSWKIKEAKKSKKGKMWLNWWKMMRSISK